MSDSNPQVPWTDEQWARARSAVLQEAQRARVAATFLPMYGPLPPSTDFVRAERIGYPAAGQSGRLTIDDTSTIQLCTLQVKVNLRGAQVADPDMTSALQMFRRAANVLARLEDAVVLLGQEGPGQGPPDVGQTGLPGIWQVLGGQQSDGLMGAAGQQIAIAAPPNGSALVAAMSRAVGELEGRGHFGPFAAVLDQSLYTAVQTPEPGSLVLPQDRIVPFFGGGPLLRSSLLPQGCGLLVALGAAPVELVVATDMTLSFLQVTTDPSYVFRVFEKIALRVREPDAIALLS